MISAGIREMGGQQSFEETLIHADNALNGAKREGPDRVRLCADITVHD